MKVGKIPTPAFIVTIKVTPMNTWIPFTQKRDSTKLLVKEALGLELPRENPFCKEDTFVSWYHILAAFNSTL